MISIITPVYRVEPYLDRCVSSIIAQSYADFELILIDDGSPDRSGEICDCWAQRDNRIRVFHQDNAGVSAARNLGLHEAKGEFITFVDSDDWLENDCLRQLLDVAVKTNADIVCCNRFENGLEQIIPCRYAEALITREEALDFNSSYHFTAVWGKLYRRGCLAGLRFREDIFYSEDTLFYTQAVMKAQTVYWMSEPLYHYFINQSGAMKTFDIKKRLSDFEARLVMVELYAAYPELQKSAVCRAVSSAVSIDMMAVSRGMIYYNGRKKLRRYVKNHRWTYLFCDDLKLSNRLFCYIYSFNFGTALYCVLRRVKLRLRGICKTR